MFLLFIGFSLASLACGYAARRRGWIGERWSRPIHLHTVIWVWAPVSLIAFWRLPLSGEGAEHVLTLMACQPLLMVAAASIMYVAIRRSALPPERRGVMLIAAGVSNHGFTLGAYLCYALLEPPDEAMGYGIAFVTSMQLFMVLVFYPIASHYGTQPTGSLGRLMVASFVTPRAMPLYAAAAGIVLNRLSVEVPVAIDRFHLLDILFFATAAGTWGGIGLMLRLGGSQRIWRQHVLVAGIQFVAHPLLTAGVLWAAGTVGASPGDLGAQVMMLVAFTPTALNTVIISNLFHLDARFAGVIWLWNTLAFAAVVLPVLLVVMWLL